MYRIFPFRLMLILLLSSMSIGLAGQSFQFTNFPKDLQLYARNVNTNKATVTVSGSISSNTYSTLQLRVYRNNTQINTQNRSISGSNPSFNFQYDITAELANYKFELYANNSLITSAEDVVAGDVYIIDGQSNAEAQLANGTSNAYLNDFTRVYESGFAVSTNQWYLGRGDGNRFSNGNTGQWGLKLADEIITNQQIPVAIFNNGHGGTPISFHQRNDGNPDDQSTNYGRLLSRLQETDLANDVRALVWYQGETDAGFISTQDYYDAWEDLYNDWNVDFPNIEQFYIHQIRHGCSRTKEEIVDIQEAQRRLANDFSDVQIMTSKGVPLYVDACHYDIGGYVMIADRMYDLFRRDLYGVNNLTNIDAPNPLQIYKSGTNQLTIVLESSADSYVYESGTDAFFSFNGANRSVNSASVSGNNLILNLSGSVSNLTSMDYLGLGGANVTGPIFRNTGGIGMVSFENFPIDQGTPTCTIGSSCDDGNSTTRDDKYNSNCDCVGIPRCTGYDIPNATITTSNPSNTTTSDGSIIFSFTNDAVNGGSRTNIEFSINGGSTYAYNALDNAGSITANNLSNGTYNLWARWGNNECPVFLQNVTLTSNCPDSDNDGVCDANDICPGGDDNIDSDGDGIPDACDTTGGGAILTGNTGAEDCVGPWVDTDGDGICNAADVCEGGDDYADADNDGIPDACEGSTPPPTGNAFLTGNTGAEDCVGPWVDTDGDGICNAADVCEGGDDYADADNDGIPDACENTTPPPAGNAVYLEAECGDVGSGWTIGSSAAASNGQYLILPNGFYEAPTSNTSPNIVSYTVNIANAGIYKIWGRVLTPQPSDDSFWVKMDNGSWIRWNGINNNTSYIWDDVHDSDNGYNTVTYDLSAGTHTLRIAYREDDGQLDKLAILPQFDAPPVGFSEDASNCSSMRLAQPERLIADKVAGRKVDLTWAANEAKEPTLYILEHSGDGLAYNTLFEELPENSGGIEVYYAKHETPLAGDNYYRLRIDYADGTSEYFEDEPVFFPLTGVVAFPNPTQNVLYVNLEELMNKSAEIKIFTIHGVELNQFQLDSEHDEVVELDLSQLQNGMYTLWLKADGFRVITQKVVVSNTY